MERAAQFSREDDAKVRLDKLDALLAASSTSREEAALLAEMLSLPNDGRYLARELAPQQSRQKTLEALIGRIEALAHQTPILMICEDAHWADPSSLELLGRLVDRIDSFRVLLLVVFRPEFAAPWIGRPHVTALTINRLTPREVMALSAGSPATLRLPKTLDTTSSSAPTAFVVRRGNDKGRSRGTERGWGGADDCCRSNPSPSSSGQRARLLDGAAGPAR